MVKNLNLNAIQKRMAQDFPEGIVDEPTVRRMWWAALDTLQEDILLPIDLGSGIWISAPLPALYDPRLLQNLKGWVWAPNELATLNAVKSGFFLPSNKKGNNTSHFPDNKTYLHLPLGPEDGHDPLLIVLTSKVQVALTLFGPPNKRSLIITTEKKTLIDILDILRLRLKELNNFESNQLLLKISNLQIIENNDLGKVLWPLISSRLASNSPSLNIQPLPHKKESDQNDNEASGEISLLEAITHEVRTPLATIRTLIRSLLKRQDLNGLVLQRLKQIDSECTEQIDRFGLIFNAAELQRRKPEESRLAFTDLGRMLKMLQPSWNDLLKRRGIALDIDITPDLPEVLSDPERLELMLGGLIDRSTRGLKPGGTLSLELRPAGNRLKLEILCKSFSSKTMPTSKGELNSNLGTVLSWDPCTGSLQLSNAATQRLLASLGGRLTHRRDSLLTVFFPIAEDKV